MTAIRSLRPPRSVEDSWTDTAFEKLGVEIRNAFSSNDTPPTRSNVWFVIDHIDVFDINVEGASARSNLVLEHRF